MTFFTADTHYGHGNITKYCRRPYPTVHAMDQDLIRRYNARVSPGDTCYFVGDFALYGPEQAARIEQVVKKLNGTKVLILGNHDRLKPFAYVELGFQSVHTSLVLPGEIVLAHDPAVATVRPDLVFLCGHVHDLFRTCKNVINVGVDVWGFSPVTLHELPKVSLDITERVM